MRMLQFVCDTHGIIKIKMFENKIIIYVHSLNKNHITHDVILPTLCEWSSDQTNINIIHV